ncbi:MAG: acyl-CoA dehydratase activase [Planctomycetota bacterium]
MIDHQYFAGIDVGASAVKVIIINKQREIVSQAMHKSGVDLVASSQNSLDEAEKAIKPATHITQIVSTGFGRNNLTFTHLPDWSLGQARRTITEISAHSKGVYYYFPKALTIIDIGAQDNKVIHIDSNGHLVNFKMNRKCAAGTGAFLEEIAYKMDIPLDKLNSLAKASTNPIELGSYCTVFTATEILSKIREGKKKEDIIRGVFSSVVKRIIEMDSLEGEVVITGGVIAYNDVIADLLKSYFKKEVLVPPLAQFTGAIGAALTAFQNVKKSN